MWGMTVWNVFFNTFANMCLHIHTYIHMSMYHSTSHPSVVHPSFFIYTFIFGFLPGHIHCLETYITGRLPVDLVGHIYFIDVVPCPCCIWRRWRRACWWYDGGRKKYSNQKFYLHEIKFKQLHLISRTCGVN